LYFIASNLQLHITAMSWRQLSRWINIYLCVIDRCWSFTEAYSNELQFTWVCCNISSCENTSNIGFHSSIHDDRTTFDLNSPFCYRAKRRYGAKVNDHSINVNRLFFFALNIRKRHASNCIITMQCCYFSCRNNVNRRIHKLLNTMLMSSEFITTMYKRYAFSNWFKHKCPVYGRVTAAAK